MSKRSRAAWRSLLSWTKRLISVRKSRKVFGRGSLSLHSSGEPLRAGLCAAIPGRRAALRRQSLALGAGRRDRSFAVARAHPVGDARTNKDFPPIGDGPYVVTLAPYGFFWFQLCESLEKRTDTHTTAPELETLVVTDGWASLLQGRSKQILEYDVLPGFLSAQRWFADRGSPSILTRIAGAIPLKPGDPGMELALVEATGTRETSYYVLPLTVKWQRMDRCAEKPERAGRRAPRPARRRDVRRHRRRGIYFGRAGQGARGRNDRSRRSPARIPSGRSIPRAWTHYGGECARRQCRAIEHHCAGR